MKIFIAVSLLFFVGIIKSYGFPSAYYSIIHSSNTIANYNLMPGQVQTSTGSPTSVGFYVGSSSLTMLANGNIGIGNNNPQATLEVSSNTVIDGAGNGLIMQDAINGDCYKNFMANGVFSQQEISCP